MVGLDGSPERSAVAACASAGAHPDAGRRRSSSRSCCRVVVLFLLALVQTALVARDQVLTVHAARARAVREASVDAGDARVHAAAPDVLDGPRSTSRRAAAIGDPVVVVVRYRSHTDLPLVGALVPGPRR